MTSVPADVPSSPTPIPISPRTRTIMLIALVIISLLLLRAMPSVVSIFLGGAILALLFSFPVRLLTRYMRRGFAILLTLLAVNVLLILALITLVPLLIDQLDALLAALPAYVDELSKTLHDLLQPLRDSGTLHHNRANLQLACSRVSSRSARIFSRRRCPDSWASSPARSAGSCMPSSLS